MIRKRLIKRSPIRILEQSTKGGLGKGNIGIIAAGAGMGKTACLVHLAIDKLMQGEHVIHVSFEKDTDHIISWYEDIFNEVAEKHELQGARQIHDEMVKKRVIMNFMQNEVSIEKITSDIKAILAQTNVHAQSIMIDGYDFTSSTPEEVSQIRDFCKEHGLEAWFSVGVGTQQEIEPQCNTTFSSFEDLIEIILCLESIDSHIHLKLLKDHDVSTPPDMHLALDPKTLLITEE